MVSYGHGEYLKDLGAWSVFLGENDNQRTIGTENMSKSLAIAVFAGLLASTGVSGQGFGGQPDPLSSIRGQPVILPSNSPLFMTNLTRFDLDFAGGTPEQLVRAIEKSSGKPLNAIIPTDLNDVEIPPLKMRAVNVAELFEALGHASQKTIPYYTGVNDYGAGRTRRAMQQFNTAFSFKTDGRPRDDSVWYFSYPKLTLPQEERVCRFWQLGPYLTEYEIDDITTAIQTGYKMLGEPAPRINFHKDTKLLIAVGEGNRLTMIDEVLRQLQPTGATSAKNLTTPAKAPANPSHTSEPSPTPAPAGTRAP